MHDPAQDERADVENRRLGRGGRDASDIAVERRTKGENGVPALSGRGRTRRLCASLSEGGAGDVGGDFRIPARRISARPFPKGECVLAVAGLAGDVFDVRTCSRKARG